MRKRTWICLALISGTVFFAVSYFLIEQNAIENASLSAQLSNPVKEKSIKIIFVGDIMLDRGVEYKMNKEASGDPRFPFIKIAQTLENADILFGNLESPISDKGSRVGSIYSFRANPEMVDGLVFAGFDVLSLANNHAFDYGRTALEDTFLRLKKAGIDYVGAGFNEKEAYSPVIKTINNTKIAFLAYTNLGSINWRASDNTGIAWLSEEKLKEDVKSAKEEADIVAVSFHLGDEYQNEPNQEQEYFSKMAIDSGADLIIGGHPHVIQPFEKYGESWIFYSLGNFVFDQGFSEETMRGQIVEVLVENKKIKEVIPREIRMNTFFQPELAE